MINYNTFTTKYVDGSVTDLLCADYIESIEDLSADGMERTHVKFKNGIKLSIIRSPFTYGGDQGLYDITPFNTRGSMDGALLDEDDQGDNMWCGYCNVAKVSHYIQKLGTIDRDVLIESDITENGFRKVYALVTPTTKLKCRTESLLMMSDGKQH
ncbi:MAG: hypothetical protein GY820_07185 [Gammaproteobacteria bacterium]|nr:hypothetical protein [Gammaproteobacteria bacterium]